MSFLIQTFKIFFIYMRIIDNVTELKLVFDIIVNNDNGATLYHCSAGKDRTGVVSMLALAPGLFNINETLIFYLPVVLNPIITITFILAPLVNGVIGYFTTSIGFAGAAVVMIPWTTPPILSAYLATAGSTGGNSHPDYVYNRCDVNLLAIC